MNWNDEEIDERLREAVMSEPLDTGALERRIRARIRGGKTSPSYRLWHAAAAAALAAAIIVPAVRPRSVPAEFHEAARDHRLEVVEHRPRRWQTDSPAVPVLAPAGYRLEHSKICRLEGKPVLHLVYTDGVHEVSVYVDQTASGGDADVDGQHVTAFETARVKGLVVGTASECRQFAAVIQRLT